MKKFFSLFLTVALLLCTLLSLCSCKRDYYVKMDVKDYGSVIIFLDGHNTPKTVKHFVKLVKSGYYDGLSFHRVIKDFMIQGGDGEQCDNVVGEFAPRPTTRARANSSSATRATARSLSTSTAPTPRSAG